MGTLWTRIFGLSIQVPGTASSASLWNRIRRSVVLVRIVAIVAMISLSLSFQYRSVWTCPTNHRVSASPSVSFQYAVPSTFHSSWPPGRLTCIPSMDLSHLLSAAINSRFFPQPRRQSSRSTQRHAAFVCRVVPIMHVSRQSAPLSGQESPHLRSQDKCLYCLKSRLEWVIDIHAFHCHEHV